MPEITLQELADQVEDLTCLMNKMREQTYLVYRYVIDSTGWNYKWWDSNQVPDHVDPRTWSGPIDQFGYPDPTAATPFDQGAVTNVVSINDNNTAGGRLRAGKIWGWVYLEAGDWIRDVNGNTGELGFVDMGSGCCNPAMQPTPGAHTTSNTVSADRSMMDPHGAYQGGWYFMMHNQSDFSAFGGLQFQTSQDMGATWRNNQLANTSREMPRLETMKVPLCDPVPEGWQCEPLKQLCQPTLNDSAPLFIDNTPTADDAIEILDNCGQVRPNFFNEQQFSWGFSMQSGNLGVSQWQYVITNANYQFALDAAGQPTQISNSNEFVYTEIDNGDGTYNHVFTSVAGLAPFSSSGTYQLNGANFGFDPTSDSQSVGCVA